MVQFYSQYIPSLSTILAPLNALRKTGARFVWTLECDRAFKRLKSELVSRRVLCHFDECKQVVLATDASQYGLSAVILHTFNDGSDRPILYAQIEREALAIVFSVRRFEKFLYGRKFLLRTDHKPLLKIFGPHTEMSGTALGRMQRWSLFLGSFDYEIEYIRGVDNSAADGLSRLPVTDQGKTLDANV